MSIADQIRDLCYDLFGSDKDFLSVEVEERFYDIAAAVEELEYRIESLEK